MYNRAILIGRLVADPELKTTPNGVNVCTFRMAVDRPYQKDKERKADFITVVAWRGAGEFVCRYFSKGKLIGIEGAIQTRDYTDKDGNRRYAFEVVADRTFFVGGKNDGNSSGTASNGEAGEPAPGGYSEPTDMSGYQSIDISGEDDLPF